MSLLLPGIDSRSHGNPARRGGTLAVTGALALTSAALFASTARADVTAVTKVTTPAGQPAPGSGPPQQRVETATMYYKGKKVRVEQQNHVTIIDGDAGKIYQINPANKTYFALPLAQPGSTPPALAMFDIKTSGDVKPNGKTRTVAGKPAKGYSFHLTIAMSLKAGAMGAPGQKPGGMPPGRPGQPLQTITFTGEEWVTQAIALPAGASGGGMFSPGGGMGGGMPAMKDIANKFAVAKGFSLLQTFNMSFSGMGMPPGGSPPPPVRLSSEVVSLRETPLADSLFKVPAGYTESKMAAPGRMRPGGPGGPGGRGPGMMPPPPPGGGRPWAERKTAR